VGGLNNQPQFGISTAESERRRNIQHGISYLREKPKGREGGVARCRTPSYCNTRQLGDDELTPRLVSTGSTINESVKEKARLEIILI
jgi:hypothetical protein